MQDVNASIIDDIQIERVRQEKMRLEGRFKFTAATRGLTNAERLPMLVGELGEIATQVEQQPDSGLMPVDVEDNFDWRKAGAYAADRDRGIRVRINPLAGTRAGLREELIQLAAIAVAWVEALDSADGTTAHAPREPTDPEAEAEDSTTEGRGI